MSQQSDIADNVFSRLSKSPVPMAHLVRELRSCWGAEHGVASVHRFIQEVATCLLHHEDVELGNVNDGQFVSWRLDPWDADAKIDRELMSLAAFLEDERRYVFRKRQSG